MHSNMLTMHSDSSRKIILDCCGDDESSKVAVHGNDDKGKVELCCDQISFPPKGERDLLSDRNKAETSNRTSGSKISPQSDNSLEENDSDSGMVETPSETDESKTLSHSDSDSDMSVTAEETDCSWTGSGNDRCSAVMLSKSSGIKTDSPNISGTSMPETHSEISGSRTYSDSFSDNGRAQIFYISDSNRTGCHGDHSLSENVSETNSSKTDCHSDNKSNVNCEENGMSVDEQVVQQEPEYDCFTSITNMSEAQQHDFVKSLYQDEFVAQLEEAVKQSCFDHELVETANNTSVGDISTAYNTSVGDISTAYNTSVGDILTACNSSFEDILSNNQFAASVPFYPTFQPLTLPADFTMDKGDIEQHLLMPTLEQEPQFLDSISATLFPDPQVGSGGTPAGDAPVCSTIPETVQNSSFTQSETNIGSYREALAERVRMSNLSLPPFDRDPAYEEYEREKLDRCDLNEADIPDVMSGEEYKQYCQQEDQSTLLWKPDDNVDDAAVANNIMETETFGQEQATTDGCPKSSLRTEDTTHALTPLNHQGNSQHSIPACLREQNRRSIDPLLQWSEQERSKFIEGLQLYGKQFNNIQRLVGTRTHKEVVEYYYIWKKTKLNAAYWEKKTLAVHAAARKRKWTDESSDDETADYSPWTRKRRERSISPVRSLISSRHKTPPPVLDDKSSPAVMSTITLTKEQQHSSDLMDLDNLCDTERSNDLESSSDSSDLSQPAHLTGSDQTCRPHSSLENLNVLSARELHVCEHKQGLNSPGSSDIAGVGGASEKECHKDSPRSSSQTEQCLEYACFDLSSDSSDTSIVCGHLSRQRRKDDSENLEFNVVLQHLNHIKRRALDATSHGSGRSDAYNSDSESSNSDSGSEASSSHHKSYVSSV